MARHPVLVFGCLALIAVFWLIYQNIVLAVPIPPTAPVTTHAPGARASGELDPSESPTENDPEPSEPQRDAVEIPGDATTGSLLLTVVWESDQAPEPGMKVEIYRGGVDALFDTPKGVTDAKGQFLFEDLAPGRVLPAARIGERRFGGRIDIVAGEQKELKLELEAGLFVKGLVIDEHKSPIAGAVITFAGWGGGNSTVLCSSAADGTFAVRGLPPVCHIGARKASYCPTSMRTITTSDGAELEITIVMDKVGGALTGQVLDPKGQPVARAAVRAGSTKQNNHELPDGGRAMGPQAELIYTDELGRFEFESVVPGKVPLAVRGRGLAPWAQDVDVPEGRTTDVTVHLERGASLFGIAKGDRGEPLAKVSIRVGSHRDIGSRSVRSAVDGSYRFDGLGSDTLNANASHDDYGRISEKFDLVAGEERRWDPVLSAGLQIRGRVIDSEGKPVERAMVEGHLDPWVEGKNWFGFESTDKDGRFTLKNCVADHTMRVTVRKRSTFPIATLKGILPGGEEIEIQLPKEELVHIEGTVLDPEGQVLANVTAQPYLISSNSGVPVETIDPKTGRFELGPYPAGKYRLTLAVEKYPTIVLERTLAANETWDTGELRFERGGSLAVQLLPDTPSLQVVEMSLPLYRGDKYIDRVQIENGTGTCNPLAPGDYELQVHGNKLAAQAVPFSIRAGLETKIDVPVTVGVAASVTCELPEGTEPTAHIELVIRDPAGRIAHRCRIWHRKGIYKQTVTMRPGTYSMTATRGELHGTAELVVGSSSAAGTVSLGPK